ncbi:MAG: TIGR03943 family protein [Anaerolineales bacterium]|nr:TIGR03943 family protein [Anaerolineales bacterium]
MQKTYRWAQVTIMLAFGLYLAERIWSGAVFFYINERFLPLIAFGAVGALVLAGGALVAARQKDDAEHHHDEHNHNHDHDHTHAPQRFPLGTVLLVALPILLGVLIPARPLGATAIDQKGLNVTGPLTVSGGAAAKLEIAPENRTILDWMRAFNYAADPSTFTNQPANVVGFVYRPDQLTGTQFLVSRFVVTCCAADGSAVGLLVEWPQAINLEENGWVRVRGPVSVGTLDGKPIPLITAASIESVPQPDQPYMYP